MTDLRELMNRLCVPTLVCALSLGACGFEAPAPQRTPPPPAPPPPVSVVSATLKVSGNDIVAMLNERTKSQLSKVEGESVSCLIQKCQLNLIVTRTGSITGHATGSGMQLALPFALHAQLDFNSKYLKTGGDAVAQGEADAVTQLSLGPDWRIAPHTQGQVHLSNANLKLGPLRMSVTELWNHNADHLSSPIFGAIDKRITSAFRLRGQIDHLWTRLQQPIRVGKSPDSWLVLSPQRLRITPLRTVDGVLVVSVAADVRAHVVVGTRPPVPNPPPKLPAPQKLGAPSNTFAVAVPVMLSYGDAVQLAMAQLNKKPLRAGKAAVQISHLKILPSGQDLVVGAKFCVPQHWDFTHLLDSCGEVFLRGAPRFDAKTGTIRIADVHYDIASQNLMLRVLQALAGDALGKALEQHLVFDESREIGKLKTEIAAALAKPQGRGIALTGQIASFGDPTLSWNKDGFVALFTAKGTVSANLNLKAPS